MGTIVAFFVLAAIVLLFVKLSARERRTYLGSVYDPNPPDYDPYWGRTGIGHPVYYPPASPYPPAYPVYYPPPYPPYPPYVNPYPTPNQYSTPMPPMPPMPGQPPLYSPDYRYVWHPYLGKWVEQM